MKSIKKTVIVLLGGLGLVANACSQSLVTNGLVAYYPFNGNVNDASGNGHDGTNHGAILTADRFGNPNQAYRFGGLSGYITAPLSGIVFSNDFTVSVWINAHDFDNAYPSILVETSLDQRNPIFVLEVTGNPAPGPFMNSLVAYEDAPDPFLRPWFLSSGTENPTPTNRFIQVLVIKAGSKVSMYVNAQVLVTGEVVNPTVTGGDTLCIGWQPWEIPAGSDVFHGVIDDIRIYSRALSSNEIAQLHHFESAPRVDLVKAVKPRFSQLWIGTNYQLQVSSDITTWTNYGSPFTATNTVITWPEYFDVDNWGKLFFRLQ
jgi:hypothetical protein